MTYNTNDRLAYFGHARMPDPGGQACDHCGQVPTHQALDNAGILQLAMDGLYAETNRFWPDVVAFISGFYVTAPLLQFLRARRYKIVMLHTESPYEDDAQMLRGQYTDLNLINDPVNIRAWRDLDVPVAYMPHAYDPDIHYPDWSPDRFECDFTFIGTLFRSRAEFFSQMDFTGLGVALGGSGWDIAQKDYPELVKDLTDYVGHPLDYCVDNEETARMYRLARCGINFYRRESEDKHQGEGWAMGPREVEMAACGLFFLRDPRAESDEVFGATLPAFHSPEEASELLHFWVKQDTRREYAVERAYNAIADRTFDNHARKALTLMEDAGIL